MSSFSLVREDAVPERCGPAAAPPVGALYDAVLVAAQAGAEWAWTLLYRSVATSSLGFLRAAGDPHPEDTLGDVVVELARGVRTFRGNEQAFRVWMFSIAYRHLVANPRRRHGQHDAALMTIFGNFSAGEVVTILGISASQAQAPLTGAMERLAASSVAPLSKLPAIPPEVEQRHVTAAARAATTGSTAPAAPPPAFRRLRPHRRRAALLPVVAAFFAGVSAKTAAAAVVALAAIGGTLALDALPQTMPARARPALEQAAAKAGHPVPARGAPLLGADSAARRSPRAVQAEANAAAAKAAGEARAVQGRARAARAPDDHASPPMKKRSLPPLPSGPAAAPRSHPSGAVQKDAETSRVQSTQVVEPEDSLTTRVLRGLQTGQRP